MTVTPADAGALLLRELLDPSRVGELLHASVRINGPGGFHPHSVRVERCWPVDEEGYMFEWSFRLDSTVRYRLFGLLAAKQDSAETVCEMEGRKSSATVEEAIDRKRIEPGIDQGALWGVLVHLPEHDLIIHSPDCDPGLPHLGRCLDGAAMAPALADAGILNGSPDSVRGASSLRCRLVGYRPGRRAAIRYDSAAPSLQARRVLGKTYRNGRGERIVRIHRRLNEELARSSDRCVKVPSPIAYLEALRMGVFSWTEGPTAPGRFDDSSLRKLGERAVDAAAALHRVSSDGLDEFTLEDERAILVRWSKVMHRVRPEQSSANNALLDALLRESEVVEPGPKRAIHRDFYEKQLVCDAQTITVLDLDTLARGAPCVDLGNLFAHLYLRALTHSGTGTRPTPSWAALLKRYENRFGAVNHNTLRFHLASSLFRIGAVHAPRTTTGRHTAALWGYTQRLLSRKDWSPFDV